MSCVVYFCFIVFSKPKHWVCSSQAPSGGQWRGYLHLTLELHWLPVHHHYSGLPWGRLVLYSDKSAKLTGVFFAWVSDQSLLTICFLCTLKAVCFSVQIDLKETRPVRQYKNFQIEESPGGFQLHGTDTFRPSLAELLEHLESQSLRTDNLHFQLCRCCPPQPRGELIPATSRAWQDNPLYAEILSLVLWHHAKCHQTCDRCDKSICHDLIVLCVHSSIKNKLDKWDATIREF